MALAHDAQFTGSVIAVDVAAIAQASPAAPAVDVPVVGVVPDHAPVIPVWCRDIRLVNFIVG